MVDVGQVDYDALSRDYRRIGRMVSFHTNLYGVARGDMLSFGTDFSPHDIARLYYRALASQDPDGFLQTVGFYLSGGSQVSDPFRALLQEFRLNTNAEAKSELFVPAFANAIRPPARLENAATLRAAIEAGLGAIAPPGQTLDAMLQRHFPNPNAVSIPTDPAALPAHEAESNRILEERANQDPELRRHLDEVNAFERSRDAIVNPSAGNPSGVMVRQQDGTIRQGISPSRRTVEEIQRELQGLSPP